MIIGRGEEQGKNIGKIMVTEMENRLCTPENPLSFFIKPGKGMYTISLEIEPEEKSNFAVIYQNGEEIGAFAVPFTGNIDEFGRYRPVKSKFMPEDIRKAEEIMEQYGENTRKLKSVYIFDVPCISYGEEEKIIIVPMISCLNERVKTYNSEGFRIKSVAVREGIWKPESLLKRERPGKSFVDLWGWMSMTSFEHPGDRVTPYEEQVERGIREAYPWGANNFEFLPVNADGVALEIEKEGGCAHYKQTKDPIWSAEAVRRIMEEAHRHGMLTEFFIYCLHGADFIATEMDFDERKALFEKIAESYSNCLKEENPEKIVDGIITEEWFPIDAPEFIQSAWKWNPGLFHLVSNNDGSQYDVHNMGYTPATHAYSAHWPGFDTQHTGYDHSYPLIPYPIDFYTQKEGTLYTYMQGCGQTCHPRKKYPRIPDIPLGITNRTVSPDWIVAQANNFGLRNLMDSKDHLAMALCWEADEQTMCPEEARRYVYAASQDPVRLAACFTLEDTGAGGELELKRNTRRFHPWDQTRLRKRSKYPASSVANGNRYLQMISLQERDETILLCDLSETGCFYNNGAVVEAGFPMLATRFRDNRFLKKQTEILESAGPRAVLVEHADMGSGFGSFRQTVRYEVYSEIPAVYASIRRTAEPGFSEEIQTILGMQDYDICEAAEGGYVLSDSDGILPQVCIWFRGDCDDAEWRPGYGLFITQNLRASASMDVVIFLRMGDFKDSEMADLKKLVDAPFVTVEEQEEIAVKNDSDLYRPVFVKISHAAKEPRWVEESGLWQHRGLSFSQEEPGCAWMRLYLKPGETGRIRPFGYLEGTVKPGKGCQNIVALEKIDGTEEKISVNVHIDVENPMLSAAILETKKEVRSVTVNGENYCYFWHNQIFLPQGHYQARVEIEIGEPDVPHLCMTYSRVEKCRFEAESNRLYLSAENQPWCQEKDEASYYGVVHLEGRKLRSLENAEMIFQIGEKVLLRWKTGEVCIIFENRKELK